MAGRLLRSGYESNAASREERDSLRLEAWTCPPHPTHPIPNDKPLGVGTEAGNLLIRFNPRLVGFGIIGPSPGRGLKDKNSEEQP